MRNQFVLTVLFWILSISVQAQLTGMNPNQALNGQTLQTTISSSGIFIQSSSPSGNLYQIRLLQGVDVITVFDLNNWQTTLATTVVDPNTVTTEVPVPFSAPVGIYDLEVITGDPAYPWWNQTTYTLPGAFEVLPPDGYITGTVYDDLNRNGIKEAGEPGLLNQQVKLLPLNQVLYTDANGDYSFPVQNGSYYVSFLHAGNSYQFVSSGSDSISVTISNSNSSGNDFGLIDALVSITPSSGFQGLSTTHQLVSDKPIFIPGAQPFGNIYQVTVFSTPNISIPVSSNVTIIDSFTVQIIITVPVSTPIANNIDIRIFTTSGYYGYHYLRDQFNIVPPASFVSGTIFYDSNQNKIYDAGEPGITGAGVTLMPDNSIGFADVSGDFLLGSAGGAQTLTPLNNIPGFTLFTDSVSYSFIATGNVTGKDFGYISSYPDYTIDVNGYYIFPRCNTTQAAQFNVKNLSNINYDVIAWFKPDPLMIYVSAPVPPTSISNDTLYWNLNLDPLENVNISASFMLPGGGNQVTAHVGAISLDSNGNPQLFDSQSTTKTITCSMDPNDKQVEPAGIFVEHFTLMTDNLEYLIRFQNTGNDTAFTVVVLDTLDSDLDFSTFEILGSSHSMQTELQSNGALRFTFNNILLVDSNMNEPESHGYLSYRVRANTSLPDSTPVNNTAYIYFDFNAPVLTNTTLNTMVFVLPVGIGEIKSDEGITLYPNPFSDFTTMIFNNPSGDKFNLLITDITGKIAMPEMHTNGNMFVIEKDKLSSGIYFYRLVNSTNSYSRSGKLLIE